MKTRQLLTTLTLGLGLTLAVGLFTFIGWAAPDNPVLDPPRNSHTAPLTTTVSITYDEPISAATVTSRTFAVHGMQSGLVTATYGVSGGKIIVTPTRPFHQGELVYAIATTGTLGLDSASPRSSVQWQFHPGEVYSRCLRGFAKIGVELTDVAAGSVAWGDYDNDGDIDILLTGRDSNWNSLSQIYRNDSRSFTNIAAGLTGVRGSSVAWGDYDNDGDLDILLTGMDDNDNRVSLIYRNNGDSFTDIDAGLTGVSSSSVAWGDYDNDGDLDILLTGYTGSSHVSRIYRNDSGSFNDINAGLTDVSRSSVTWGDYDNDGDLDILLTGYTGSNHVSRVYRNNGGNPSEGWSSTNIDAGLAGVHNGSVAWGDYDNDGDLDILLTGSGVSLVYRNEDGNFTDIDAGLTGVSSSSVAWGDYDNDGDLDILLTGEDNDYDPVSQVYRNDGGNPSGGWTFTNIRTGLTDVHGSSVAWGDYDSDGDLDILLTGEGPASWILVSQVYRNDDCSADPSLIKTVTPPVAAPGDTITYTLTFFNAASADDPTATGVVITDIVPLSITINSVVSSGTPITDTGVSPPYVWQVQDLAPGKGGVITITGRVSSTLSRGTILINTATIASADADADITNNTDDARVTVGKFIRAALFHPPRNSHTASLTTTVSAAYDEPISAATVTSHTFVIHAMQSGLLTATHSVANAGGTISVTPTRPLHQGELVYAIATTGTLNITGTEPFYPTQWQFCAGQVNSRCVGGLTDIKAEITGVQHGSVAWGDYDNDGDLDILLSGYADSGPVSRIYRNDDGSFTNIAGLTGVYWSSVAWGDYDNDGDLDILLTGYAWGGRVSRIYRNDGGNPSGGWTFTNIKAGLTNVECGSAAWGDYDNDGDLDILLTGKDSDVDYVSQVYRNDDGSFSEISAGLTDVNFGSAAWGDYDNDGDLDILLTGYYYWDHDHYVVSLLYRNDGSNPSGGWTFTNIKTGLTGVCGSSVAWGDYDNDGDLDILLTGRDGDENLLSQVYRNDGPSAGSGWTFTDIGTELKGVHNGSAAWGDYDNDGDLDILLTGETSISYPYPAVSRIYRNDGGNFTDIGAGLTDVSDSSAAWGDYDNDGDLDILLTGYVGLLDYVSLVYRNDDCFVTYLPLIMRSYTP